MFKIDESTSSIIISILNHYTIIIFDRILNSNCLMCISADSFPQK
jgi:hypothetical protein